MQTHFLGAEEVEAYLKDLAGRLQSLGDDMPSVWVPIGPSGRELVKALVAAVPELDSKFEPVPAEFDRSSNTVSFEDSAKEQLAGKRVLVIDSSVHSGHTMKAVVDRVCALGATKVCSYTLVIKRGATFVPSFWGVTIGDFDRAYFLLSELPNNHFNDLKLPVAQVRERHDRNNKRSPYFHLRKLSETDIKKPQVKSGVDSLDRTTWADRYYDMKSHHGRYTYLLEAGQNICGYLTYELHQNQSLSVEAVAVDEDQQSQGYGAALIRWAETTARQSNCGHITLWGIKEQVSKYERLGYKKRENQYMDLDGEEYYFMSRPVLYHL